MALEELTQDLAHNPRSYSPWLPHVLQTADVIMEKGAG